MKRVAKKALRPNSQPSGLGLDGSGDGDEEEHGRWEAAIIDAMQFAVNNPSISLRESALIGGHAAICMFVLLATSLCPAVAEPRKAIRLAQQQIMTATASSATRADACTSATDKAYNLCMIQGLFNIKSVHCECTQSGVRGAPAWECVGTAECQK